ncbi:MAG: hypothetical protein ABIH67_02015 [Candidatus Uhrbacteria bacterium]
MSKTPQYDKKIKEILDGLEPGEQICSMTNEKWQMTDTDIDMYRQFNVPPFTVAPEQYHKMAWMMHTGWSWWWNKDANTGKPVLTAIHPHTQYKVVADETWYNSDYSELGIGVKPEQSFFDQLYELSKVVPMSATKNVEKPVNSIARISFGDEDSYFVEGTTSKRSYYCSDGFNYEDCAEVTWSNNVTRSYDVLHSEKITNCIMVRESRRCLDCDFVFDCRDCEFCFMSANQRHKKYLWRNQQLTQEEWERRRDEIDLGHFDQYDQLRQEFYQLVSSEAVWPENFNEHSTNSTGEYVQNCTNVERGWYCDGAQNSRWIAWGNMGTENSAMGIDVGSNQGYGNIAAIKSSGCRFCNFANYCQNCEYCTECHNCDNCFGCIGLRHKKFHILNKEYSEDEYWLLVDKIKCQMLRLDEYGKPFESRFMLTCWQHCSGHVFSETSEEELQRLGVELYDPASDGAYGDWSDKTMYNVEDIPIRIDDVSDDIVGKAFLDSDINRPYAILKPELEFYRKMRLPVRREHWVKRIEDQWKEMNMMKLDEQECQQCSKTIKVAWNNVFRNRKVYCRECYLKYLEQNG